MYVGRNSDAPMGPAASHHKFGHHGRGHGQFNCPIGIAINASNGNIYVTESVNNRVQVFNASKGFVFTFGSSGSDDGQLKSPFAIAVDVEGNMFVADTENHRIQVFDSSGGYLRKFGSQGTKDGQFIFPFGVAIDSKGNIIVVDSVERIQMFDHSGVFLRCFGRGDGSGDGKPRGVAVDQDDNIIVVDSSNNRIRIWTCNGDVVREFGSQGNDDGQFQQPASAAVEPNGNILVVDQCNNRIQEFTPSGLFLRKMGEGKYTSPSGVAVGNNKIYVTDSYNHRVCIETCK